MIHLHVRSWYSFLAGASSPESLAEQAARLGQPALALTDLHGLYGAVRFARACKKVGVRPLFGATLQVRCDGDDSYPLVFLAQDREGYANLCRLLNLAHRHKQPEIAFNELEQHRHSLIVLTGGRESWLDTLVLQGKITAAEQWLTQLQKIYRDKLFVEFAPSGRPGDRRRLETLTRLSRQTRIEALLTNDVRYACREHFPRYDALTCVRLGLTVDDPHPQRPVNDRATLCTSQELFLSLNAVGESQKAFYMQALERTLQIALQCQLDLLPDEVTPPSARLPQGLEPNRYLRQLCDQGLEWRYRGLEMSLQQSARQQLERELQVVEDLELSEFFLVVREVTEFARGRGIRCAGRGSAANSIIAYLLGITSVDPLVHRLLFERFLHRGRKGMPDIDVDFDSERRPEVIAWMEQRFGEAHCAMTATLQTYQIRGAMREMMKVLGWDSLLIDRSCKLVGHWETLDSLRGRRGELEAILGCTPMMDVLFRLVEGLLGCPRHLGLHNGGMVLTRKPLPYYSPIQTSAGGYRQVQFDKDDVEALGLIKFDVLGLRMLAALTEAVHLHQEDSGQFIDLENLPPEDQGTYDLICSGETMSLFQIESPGQMNLLARTQPRHFNDLVIQVALFRPGPLQGGMVNPYLLRHAGLQEVEFPHPCLAPILQDTQGIIVFQEQVLEICHQFAGLSLEEADEFRRLMSRWRDPGNMETMGEQFIQGAINLHGIDRAPALEVFRQVAAFVGYGFCRSHAAAFARTVYQSAYLKRHYPAAYMAAVMQHLPGFFPKSTVLEEARHLGVRLLPVCILRSRVKYRLENGAIRLPFTQVKEISQQAAQLIEEWQKWGSQESGESFWDNLLTSVPLDLPQWESLARAGAFQCKTSRRDALWRVGLYLARGAGTQKATGQQLLQSAFQPSSADFGSSADRSRRSYRRPESPSGDGRAPARQGGHGESPSGDGRAPARQGGQGGPSGDGRAPARQGGHGESPSGDGRAPARQGGHGESPSGDGRAPARQGGQGGPSGDGRAPARQGGHGESPSGDGRAPARQGGHGESPSGDGRAPARQGGHGGPSGDGRAPARQGLLLSTQRDLPQLQPVSAELQLSWDFSTQSVSCTAHPMSQHRRRLEDLGVLPLRRLKEMPVKAGAAAARVRVAGWVLVRQKPPTAKGMMFILIEDETARLQVAVPPPQVERWRNTLLGCQSLLVIGRLEGPLPLGERPLGNYRSVMLEEVYDLEEHLGRPLMARDELGPPVSP